VPDVSHWRLVGDWFDVCKCTIPCPCTFAQAPSEGDCEGILAWHIREGSYGEVQLDDLNVVVQQFANRKFDLVVATNVFVYYDVFDQALALANVGSMLRPGGFLLSNNALIELPSSRMRSVGYLTTSYSNRPDDGDHVVWYRRTAN